MQKTSSSSETEIVAPVAYQALRIASWVALVAILAAIGWATAQAVINWDVIRV